jgi:hypothetical protein
MRSGLKSGVRRGIVHYKLAAVIGGVALALGFAAYFSMYSTDQWYDDSGYWMIALKSYIGHGGLYNTTYTQCGPFYYQFWSAVYWLTGLKVDPDTGHFMSLCTWITASLLVGAACWTLTRSLVLALLGEVAGFILLESEINEPMEPAHLSYLLVGFLLVIVCALPRLDHRGRTVGGAAIGVLCSALVFTKINIGVLVVCAVCFAVAVCWPDPTWRRRARPIAAVAVLLVPLVIMWPSLNHGRFSMYGYLFILLELSLCALMSVARLTLFESPPFEKRALQLGVLGAVVAAMLICIGALTDGTSISQLIDGAFLSQRKLVNLFRIPVTVRPIYLEVGGLVCGAGLAASIWLARTPPERRQSLLRSKPLAAIRILAGAWMLITACAPLAFAGHGFAIGSGDFVLAVPFTWIAVLGVGDSEAGSLAFARILIASVGVLGCIEAYPVAGSQLGWAGLSLVPPAVLCIWDGSRVLHVRHTERRFLRSLTWAPAAVTCALLAFGQVWPEMRAARALYDTSVGIQLPGAHEIRQSVPVAISMEQAASFLTKHCSTFEGSPGLNSFYFYTQQVPPTGLNTTQWRKLLTPEQQNLVIRKLRTIPRLCVLENSWVAAVWYPPKSRVPASPLYNYLQRNFVTVATYGYYSVQVRRSATAT